MWAGRLRALWDAPLAFSRWTAGELWVQPAVSLRHWRGYGGRTAGPHLDHEIDLDYTSPTDIAFKESRQIRKYRQRVEDALVGSLLGDGVLHDELIRTKGFTVCEVRVRQDKQVAYIQWSCFPGKRTDAQNTINRHMKRIRKSLGDRLASRSTPHLQFCHDSLTAEQREVEQVFSELENEGLQDKLEGMLPPRLHVDPEAFEQELLQKARKRKG
eukprot:evm.model.scf_1235.4 EVM.evm.TU.scf_1235.4   scf_1235:28979-32289(-)